MQRIYISGCALKHFLSEKLANLFLFDFIFSKPEKYLFCLISIYQNLKIKTVCYHPTASVLIRYYLVSYVF